MSALDEVESESGLGRIQSADRQSADRHWVEELFPPTFMYLHQDIIDDRPTLLEGVSEEDSLFAQLANNISPSDLAAIKNVYQRVWLMVHLKKKEQGKTEETRHQNKEQQTDDTQLSAVDKVSPCIWSREEIQIIRTDTQTTKTENSKLRAELKLIKEELTKLQADRKCVRSKLELQTTALRDAVKANHRLQLLSEHLNLELKRSTNTVNVLNIDLSNARQDCDEQRRRVNELQRELDSERMLRERAEMTLERECVLLDGELRLVEQKLSTRYENKIAEMTQRIHELSQELQEKSNECKRSNRGLEHLRMHFASLPLTTSSNLRPVNNDQLTTWTVGQTTYKPSQ